jgi:hypothetical protein
MSDFIIIVILTIIFGSILTVSFLMMSKKVKNSNLQSNITTEKGVRPSISDLTEIYKDIIIEPYGCFTNIEDKFFLKQINPYRDDKVFDSGMIIDENQVNVDTDVLIKKVLSNGFDKFANHIINKYNGNYVNMDIIDIASLGKLAGYNYFTIFKINEHERSTIYLTYSPPMDNTLPINYSEAEYKEALTVSELPNYTLTPKAGKYANENNLTPGTELSCGYPCYNSDGKVYTFNDSNGVERNYMCGSVTYPTIKTAPRYSVYKIKEIK